MRWWISVLFACSSPRATPTPPPVVPIDAKPAIVATDAAPPSFADYPAPLSRPRGCTLAGKWDEQPHELRLSPTSKPFANLGEVKRADATFGDGVFLEVTTTTVSLAGFADASKVSVYAAHPYTVAGFAAPGPNVQLELISAKDGHIAFEVAMPDGVKAKAPVRGERLCNDFAIDDTTKFSPRDAVEAETTSEAHLRPKRAIPLSLEPGKPAVAELRYDESPKIDILETKANQTRVAVDVNSLNPQNNVVVFGWVPSSAIFQDNHGFGGSWARGGGRGIPRGRRVKGSKLVECATEVPLVVEHEQQRVRIGAIAPKTILEVMPGGDDFVEVRFHRPDVESVNGARWLAKQSALATCAAASE